MPKFLNDPVISNTTIPSGVDNYNGGIAGSSSLYNGVLGSTTAEGHAGVAGVCDEGNGNGVYGRSKNRNGVYGVRSAKEHAGIVGGNETGTAVLGRSISGLGVWGLSDSGIGVVAQTRSVSSSALAAYQSNPNSPTAALHAKHDGGKLAALLEGNVEVTGDLILAGADVAESLDAAEGIAAGQIVVIGEDGQLQACSMPYDTSVAGIVSGAGDLKPAAIMSGSKSGRSVPLALVGTVWCFADASCEPIAPGDLLTTSSLSGHAMRAIDKARIPGAVVGKALSALNSGTGLVRVLVSPR
jgi:hypothetical protein